MKIEIEVGDTVEVVNRDDEWNGQIFIVSNVPDKNEMHQFIGVIYEGQPGGAGFQPSKLKVIEKADKPRSTDFKVGDRVELKSHPGSIWIVTGHDYRYIYDSAGRDKRVDVVLLKRPASSTDSWDHPENLVLWSPPEPVAGSVVVADGKAYLRTDEFWRTDREPGIFTWNFILNIDPDPKVIWDAAAA